jgi:hypothetical protein
MDERDQETLAKQKWLFRCAPQNSGIIVTVIALFLAGIFTRQYRLRRDRLQNSGNTAVTLLTVRIVLYGYA